VDPGLRGIGDALAADMADGEEREVVARSRRLIAASQDFIRAARSHMDVARQRMERARNVLQAAWLLREMRRRGDRRRAISPELLR